MNSGLRPLYRLKPVPTKHFFATCEENPGVGLFRFNASGAEFFQELNYRGGVGRVSRDYDRPL